MTNKWVCSVCDYLYDPQAGDPEGGIPPGTAFEALPEGWCCPDCGAKSRSFDQV
ncbi:MAG: rubredoxin [Magnetococcus sp. XQGC-1]